MHKLAHAEFANRVNNVSKLPVTLFARDEGARLRFCATVNFWLAIRAHALVLFKV